MNQVAWITDIHLDRLSEADYAEYKEYLEELNPDALLISGDIAEGEKVCQSLADFDHSFLFPIYFVLGNHDFYFRRFAQRESEIRALVEISDKLHWLTETGPVKLNDSTVLIGVEGWGDGGHGTINVGRGYTKDLVLIEDYEGLKLDEILKVLASRGDHYAAVLRPKLEAAVRSSQNVILLTHVPPFVEVCFDRGMRVYDEFRQPFYTCKSIGDLLLEVMEANRDCQLTVLCGHTHETADAEILANLRVRVKEAGYGNWWNATMIKID
jgi:Icc protein